MSKRKVVFDFGSSFITIYGENRLLLRKPTCLIIRRSLMPYCIATGDDALKRQIDITDEELFVRPISKGRVAHFEGLRILIKEYLREACGKRTSFELCVLISCGLDTEQKREIEKVFVLAGYTNIYLLESILGLSYAAGRHNTDTVVVIGGDMSEVGILNGREIIAGYSLDVGSNLINRKIQSGVQEVFKVHLSDAECERIKLDIAGLHAKDLSVTKATGLDILTGRAKRLVIAGKDIYAETVSVFGKIERLLEGALMAAPVSVVNVIEQKGVLFAGKGADTEGLKEFFYQKLRVPIKMEEKPHLTVVESAYRLIQDDTFISNYLGLKYRIVF